MSTITNSRFPDVGEVIKELSKTPFNINAASSLIACGIIRLFKIKTSDRFKKWAVLISFPNQPNNNQLCILPFIWPDSHSPRVLQGVRKIFKCKKIKDTKGVAAVSSDPSSVDTISSVDSMFKQGSRKM